MLFLVNVFLSKLVIYMYMHVAYMICFSMYVSHIMLKLTVYMYKFILWVLERCTCDV